MSCPPASAAPPEPYPGHDPGPLSQRWCFRATGTRWQLLTASPLSSALRTHLTALVADFEDVWSRFRPDSLIRRAADGRLGAGALTLDLPPGSAVLLDRREERGPDTRGFAVLLDRQSPGAPA